MKKGYLLLGCLVLFIQLYAQETIIEKSFIPDSKTINLDFDFPKAKISTWNKNEIYIKAIVNINSGKYNDRFKLIDKEANGTINISDTILDIKHMDPDYYIEANGEKKHFESEWDFENYKKIHKGETFSSYSSSNIDVKLEIIVPANKKVFVKSKFGLIEVKDYTGDVNVTTQFGKIDVTLNQSKVGHLKLTNSFGKIYSNFDIKPLETESDERFHTVLTASPGNGSSCQLSSKFGNIYLRKIK